MIRRPLLLLVLFLLFFLTSHAQKTNGLLPVVYESELHKDSLLQRIAQTGPDTSRVNSFIKISRIYWFKKTVYNSNVIDSCFLFAKRAFDLSFKLRYTEGSNEALFMMCKVYLDKKQIDAALKLAYKAYGEEQARLLIIIAESFVFNYQSVQKEFTQSLPLIQQAQKASKESGSEWWSEQSLLLLGKYYFKQGDIKNGKKAILEIISWHHKSRNYSKEAHYWSEMGLYMPETDANLKDIRNSHQMAVHYYLLANDKKSAAYSLRDLAVINGNHHENSLAEKQLLEMIRLFKSGNIKMSVNTYFLLADFYRYDGQYNKALYYGLIALKEAGNDENILFNPYKVLADVYFLLGDHKKSIQYYHKLLKISTARNERFKFYAAFKIATYEVSAGNPRKADAFLKDFIKENPPEFANDRQLFASVFGDINTLSGNYIQAEKYYLEMLGLEKQVEEENGKDLGGQLTMVGSGAQFTIGKFYATTKKYQKAKLYLQKSLDHPNYWDAAQAVETFYLMFKADSALGNYVPAIKSLMLYKKMTDSINSVSRARQITELNVRYQTERNIKDIKLLQNKEKMQRAEIQKSRTTRNVTFGGAALLMLIAAITYNGYRNKQVSNRKLESQKVEIDKQNEDLQVLLGEKDRFLLEKDALLKDKDWLLKEVHHRVKNNLQIVMGLLRAQSAYLINEDAKDAILESENRVQSVALIHQKLYSNDNTASIAIKAYVNDLVNYLTDVFDTRKRNIMFWQEVEELTVDLSQAVPVGLILNEAITNAIKYAFSEDGGDIIISCRKAIDEKIVLTISDNGKGLPADFDFRTASSLGIEMMRGLSTQLNGRFYIESVSGTVVSVEFRHIQLLK